MRRHVLVRVPVILGDRRWFQVVGSTDGRRVQSLVYLGSFPCHRKAGYELSVWLRFETEQNHSVKSAQSVAIGRLTCIWQAADQMHPLNVIAPNREGRL